MCFHSFCLALECCAGGIGARRDCRTAAGRMKWLISGASFSAFYSQIPLDLWVLYNEMHSIDSGNTRLDVLRKLAWQVRSCILYILLSAIMYFIQFSSEARVAGELDLLR